MPEKFSTDEERRAYNVEKTRRWQQRNPEKVREMKRRYYASEQGKAQKKRDDAAYIASGGRAATEARRAARPVSEARKEARRRWAKNNTAYLTAAQAKRRSLNGCLDAFSFWVLQEAVHLCRVRERVVGGVWHVDHVKPVSKGGDSHYTNLQVVPALWNRRKSNVHAERFFGA